MNIGNIEGKSRKPTLLGRLNLRSRVTTTTTIEHQHTPGTDEGTNAKAAVVVNKVNDTGKKISVQISVPKATKLLTYLQVVRNI